MLNEDSTSVIKFNQMELTVDSRPNALSYSKDLNGGEFSCRVYIPIKAMVESMNDRAQAFRSNSMYAHISHRLKGRNSAWLCSSRAPRKNRAYSFIIFHVVPRYLYSVYLQFSTSITSTLIALSFLSVSNDLIICYSRVTLYRIKKSGPNLRSMVRRKFVWFSLFLA